MWTHYRRRRWSSWLSRLVIWEPVWLLLLGPSLLFTEYFWDPALRPLLILALFLFWPLRLRAGLALLPAGAIGWLTGFLLIWLPITLGLANGSDAAWEAVGYAAFALAIFVALSQATFLHKRPYLVVIAIGLIGVIFAVVGPESLSVNPDKLLDRYATQEFEVAGTALHNERINPNILGALLAMVIPLLLAASLWAGKSQWWLQLIVWPPLLLMGNALLLSQSRGAWLALSLAAMLLVILRWSQTVRLFVVSAILVTGAALFSLRWSDAAATPTRSTATLVTQQWRPQVDSTVGWPQAAAQSARESLMRRFAIWRLSLQLLAANPISGIGMGNYQQRFTAAFPNVPLPGGRIVPPHAHNLLLQVALDLGIPGLITYVGLLVLLLRKLLRNRQAQPSALWPNTVVSIVVVILLIGCFDNALWGTKLMFLPWSIFALGLIVEKLAKPYEP